MATGNLPNVCPKCGSENLNYGDTELCGNELGYEFECEDCGCQGTEWYKLSFIETVSNDD
jgi:hypothetical protein